MSKLRRIEQAFAREDLPVFKVGDTVDIHVRIREGDKERVQIFNGTVIRRKGGGMSATYTVRRIVNGQGVERTFPLNSPHVLKVEVKRSGKTRRAKLYFLRDRTGKATRLKEVLGKRPPKKKSRAAPAPAPDPEPSPEAESAPPAED